MSVPRERGRVTIRGVGMVLAAGINRTSGNLNIPFNIAVVPSKAGTRVSLLAGFNSE